MSIVRMKGQNNQDIYIEIEDNVTPATRGFSIVSEEIEHKAQEYTKQFGKIGDYIMTVCSEIYDKYKTAAKDVRPDEIELQFGIKLSGETCIPFISKGAAEATIQVKAKWTKPKEQTADKISP